MNPQERLRAHLELLDLDTAVVSAFLARFRARHVRRKGVFVRAGELDARLGFVASGLFAMETVHEDGHLFIKDFLPEGTFLLGTFSPTCENLVTFRALRDSVVLEARYADIQTLQRTYPALDRLARQGMEQRYAALCTRLEQLAGLDAAARYQAFRTAFQAHEAEIPLNLVAAYLNITPTQLSRLRKKHGLST
jgi:CRP-like cAMP-binding protein